MLPASRGAADAWYSVVQKYFASLYNNRGELEYRLIEAKTGFNNTMKVVALVLMVLHASLSDAPVAPLMLARGNICIGA
jgi:hypothetical protein